MRPFHCRVTTLLIGIVLIGMTTGCAEKRHSTRYLTEPSPAPTAQAEAAAQQTQEKTEQNR